MCFKYINIVYCWVYLCCQVSLSRCEVTYVYRDKSNDIFRIGNDNCTKNESVCTSAKAYCSPSNGLCFCKHENSHFRNPTIEIKDSSYRYGSSYGCLTENLIQQRINKTACTITPYQLIPYDPNKDAITFILNDGQDKCYLRNVEAKYPSSNIQHNIPCLNESFIEFGFPSGNAKLSVKWKRSVPSLQGLIITISLRCTKVVNGMEISTNFCLKAKVSGAWTLSEPNAPTCTTKPTDAGTTPKKTSDESPSTTPTSASSPSPSNKKEANDKSSSTAITQLVQTASSTPGNGTGQLSSTDGGPNGGVIAVAIIIPFIILVVVLVIAWRLVKRRKEKRQMGTAKRLTKLNINDVNQLGVRNTSTAIPNADVEMQKSEYAKPEPGEIKPVKKPKAEPKNKVETGISKADIERQKTEYAKPEVKRAEVNGDMYTIVNKPKPQKTTGPNELDYMAPENLNLDLPPSAAESYQPTEYAAIAGVLKEVDQ